MTITVRNDAKTDTATVERYERLIAQALPLATELAGIPIPADITLRIATAQQFIAWSAVHDRLLNQLYINQLDGAVSRWVLSALNRVVPRRLAATFAPIVQGAVIWRPDGPPDIIVMPASHAESRATDRRLTGVLVHEITQLAQITVSPVLAYAKNLFNAQDYKLRLAFEERRAPFALSEGHGTWVQSRASERLCGVASPGPLPGEPEPTARFVELSARLAQTRALYDLGAAFVAAIYNHGGYPLIEQVLMDPGVLCPTNKELRDPQAWLHRHQTTA
ncbi:hypothetical protein [Kitasatospora sp. NPDC005856]|uniref:hypothetical protein n=1 Tax=Kitasatospora sp. NPDC005856 TaxID=3154566 RepID=UPI0033F6B627